jgi:hypothetical protein
MSDSDINIISAVNLVENRMKIHSKTNDVIKANRVIYNPDKVHVIGGDTSDFSQDKHPAIIIEKNGSRLSKIIVRCPCGRHSELICDYELDEDSETDSAPAEPITDDSTPNEE